MKRVHERTGEIIGSSELHKSKIDELTGYFEPNHQFYLDNPIITVKSIDTEKLNPEQVVEIIIGKLS